MSNDHLFTLDLCSIPPLCRPAASVLTLSPSAATSARPTSLTTHLSLRLSRRGEQSATGKPLAARPARPPVGHTREQSISSLKGTVAWPRAGGGGRKTISMPSGSPPKSRPRTAHPATPKEQAQLIRFTGFGTSELADTVLQHPGKTAFGDGWDEIGTEMEEAVLAQDYASLARCTQHAYFTPRFIIRAIWAGLVCLGWHGGRVARAGNRHRPLLGADAGRVGRPMCMSPASRSILSRHASPGCCKPMRTHRQCRPRPRRPVEAGRTGRFRHKLRDDGQGGISSARAYRQMHPSRRRHPLARRQLLGVCRHRHYRRHPLLPGAQVQ